MRKAAVLISLAIAAICQPAGARPFAPACGMAKPGFARCLAQAITGSRGIPLHFATGEVAGYGPQQFRTAYGVSGMASGAPVIAVVDAYGDPAALNDLNVYSAEFGIAALPKCSGEAARPAAACFRAVNQNGGSKLPKHVDAGWALEQALDIELAHALCENCSILLVETKSNSLNSLGAGENAAAALGAAVISNSWGGSESAGETDLDARYFTHPGVAMTASAGASGFGLNYPAASPNVTAVGGTTLLFNADGSYKEELAVFEDGGCSLFEPRPAWQKQRKGCPNNRTDVDISADGDPNTGAAVYDSVGCSGDCWMELGGTSISAPMIAGVFALANNVPPDETQASRILYENATGDDLHDITKGLSGGCQFKYMCQAVKGYDAPTGLGTPLGLGDF